MFAEDRDRDRLCMEEAMKAVGTRKVENTLYHSKAKAVGLRKSSEWR